jgi:FkbM family methyltransferase
LPSWVCVADPAGSTVARPTATPQRVISKPLVVKQALVGTRPGRVLRRLRWWAGAWQRFRHPELWDMYLEDRRVSVALAALIGPNSNCVDVGAHIGSTLARMVELAPDGRHFAIEPMSTKAQALRQRFPNIPILNAAVSSAPGSATLYEARESGYSSLRPPLNHEVVGQVEVDVVRLDDVLDTERRVDFLKLDVEGAELPALRGAVDTIKRDQPVVLFESGPNGHTASFDYTRTDLFGFFADLGYRIYSIADFVYGRAAMTVDEFEKAGTYPYPGFNYLALPAERQVQRLID